MFEYEDYFKNRIKKKVDIDCTKYMQNLFGDGVVSSAVTSIELYDTSERIEEMENIIKDTLEESLKTLSIDFDCIGDLEVTFVSGKTLKFWVSEWGGMKTKSLEDSK